MDEAPVQLEAPSKIVTTDTTVNVRARIACFDCQGRSDARSIREILVKVAPQQLILLHGLPQVSIPAYACDAQCVSVQLQHSVSGPTNAPVDWYLHTREARLHRVSH